MKYKRKKIETTLTVLLMKGKTVRSMYEDFFGGRLPKDLDGKEVVTLVSIDGINVPYEVYLRLSGHGATRELLEQFEFKYVIRSKIADENKLYKEMNKVIPFNSPEYIDSSILTYTLGVRSFDQHEDIRLKIQTYTYESNISEDTIKLVNKDNARRLRKYLIKLPSVQGVPYSCTYREDDVEEEKCLV